MLGGFFSLSTLASALDINGYSTNPTRYDRFVSGTYPPDPLHGVYPQPNPSSNFIGLGYDWSGVGWSATNYNQSFALLGPQFFLYANHYTPAVGSTIDFTASNGAFHSYTVQSVSGRLITGSDLAIGMFTSPIPSSDNVHSYSILFLGYDTSPNSPYYNTQYQNLLLYGWTARIGWNSLTNIYPPGTFSGDQGYYFEYPFKTTPADRAKLVSGDSGSPTFITTGTPGQMYLAGDHYAIVTHTNGSQGGIDSFLALELPQISAYMAQYGYLPYVVTPSTATWNGADGLWGTPANWSLGEGSSVITEDTLNGNGQVTTCASLVFDGSSSTASRSISLGGVQRTVTGVTFKSAPGANAFTFNPGGTGGSLRIGEAGIVNNDDDTQILNCNIVLRSSQRWSVGQGGLSVSGSIDTDTGDLLLIEGNGNTTLSGQIFNSGGLAKDGLGTLTLSNSGNSYTGSTWIHAGTLALGNSNVIPDGSSLVVDGGILALDGFSDVVNSITLQNGTISSTTGVLSSSSFDLRNGTITAKLSGAGTLTKNTSGTVVLSGSNSYTGGTTINGGVLQFAASTALPASGNITINTGGTLQASGPYSLVGGTTGWLYSGRIVNTSAGTIALVQDEGNINMAVAGYTSLSLGAIGNNVTYTGTLTPVNNIYRLGGGGGTLTVNSNLVDGSSRSLVVGGGGSGGIVVLAGTGNTYSGGTTVSAGTLRLGNASALGSTLALTTVASGATLDVNGYTVTLGSLSGQGVVSLPGGKISIDANNSSTTFSGTISGAGQVEKIGSGTLLLSGSNTYSGITTISSGTLQIGGGDATGALGTNSVVDNADLWFNRSDNITVSNLISGSGNVQQKGSGILTLSGANAYSGTATVNSGTLKLANTSALGTIAGGTIVQSGGTLDLNGLSIGNEPLTIYGTGIGGNGALINTNTSATAVLNGILTLGANASTGGSGNITLNGSMNYGSYAFTKYGTDTLTFTGPQIWGDNASATVQSGTLSYQQASGAMTSVSASTPATTPTLYIASAATVNVNASNNDPFTDDTTSTRHVQIVNYTTGNLNLTGGTVSLAGISGGGATTITGGSILNSDYIYQSQLTIGSGSKLVINSISGPFAPLGLSTGDLNTLPISGLSTLESAAISPLNPLSQSTQSGADITGIVPVSNSGLSLVPEPSTWILLVIAALCLLCRCKRK